MTIQKDELELLTLEEAEAASKPLSTKDVIAVKTFLEKYFLYGGKTNFNIHGRLSDKDGWNKFDACKKVSASSTLIQQHVEGKVQIGTGPLFFRGDQSGGDFRSVARWSAIDIDVKDDLRAAEQAAIKIYRYAFIEYGLHCYIEKSRSKGYHIWFFYDYDIPGHQAWALMASIQSQAGFGNFEYFPKTTDLKINEEGAVNITLALPLCGEFFTKNKTVFVEPHLNRLHVIKDQAQYVKDMVPNDIEAVRENAKMIKAPENVVNRVGLVRGGENYSGGKINVHTAKEKCEVLRRMSSEDTNDYDYRTWSTVCLCMSKFINWEEGVDGLIANTKAWPENRERTKERVGAIISSGKERIGGKCEYTGCPKKGDKLLCEYQSINKCLDAKEDPVPECKFDLDNLDNVEESVRFINLKNEDDKNLRELWEYGSYHYKGNTISPPPKSKMTVNNRYDLCGRLAQFLASREFPAEICITLLSLYEFGLREKGSMKAYWRMYYSADRWYKKKSALDREESLDGAKLPFAVKMNSSGKGIGIYKKEKTGTSSDGVPDFIWIKYTDFAMRCITKIVDRDKNMRFLYNVYPACFRGQSFPVVIGHKKQATTDCLQQEIERQLIEADVQIFKSGPNVANMIIYCSKEAYSSKCAFSVDDPGFCEEADAFFFSEFYIHKGRCIYVNKGDYLITIGNKHFWLEYLHNPKGNAEDLPNPRHELSKREGEVIKLRDDLVENFPLMWGGPQQGKNALVLLGWLCAFIYKDRVKEPCLGFPLVYVNGNMSSGKNHNLDFLGGLLGFRSWTEVSLQGTTEAGVKRILAIGNIVWLDEHKSNYGSDKIEEILKPVYTGGKTVKADQTSPTGVVEIFSQASVVLTSETLPKIDAFSQRCLMLNISSKWRDLPENKKQAEEVKRFLCEDHGGKMRFSEIFTWILRNKTEKVADDFERTLRDMQTHLIRKYSANNRTAGIYAAAYAGFARVLFQDRGEDDWPKENILRPLMEFIGAKVVADMQAISRDPTVDYLNTAIEFFQSAENKQMDSRTPTEYPVRVHTQNDEGFEETIMYVDVKMMYRWFKILKSQSNLPESIGSKMICSNMKEEGYIGQRDFKSSVRPKKGMYTYSEGCRIYDHLKCIAYEEVDGVMEKKEFEDDILQ